MNYESNPLHDLQRLTEAVSATHTDIAPSYLEYTQMAFAIATDCGEAGRRSFITLCSFSSKHNEAAAQRLFSNALRTTRNDAHLGTVFHLARLHGVEVKPEKQPGHPPPTNATNAMHAFVDSSHTCARYNKVENRPPYLQADGCEDDPYTAAPAGTDGETTFEGTDPLSSLPTFRQDYEWPAPLNKILSFGRTPAQRDVLLLGGFTVLGASLAPVVRCLYGQKWQYPCLQTFVVAHAAAGKGVLVWTRKIIEPLHEEIRDEVEKGMRAYRKEKSAYDALGKAKAGQEPPVPPPNRMFIFSGNNSGTGLLQNIIDSGGMGIICESEADTVSAAIGTEYGNWSDTLRKAFDHDRLSYNRRTDREYREVVKCCLSLLISGTPAQVKPLIPSSENGLFSRNVFYYMPRVQQWASQFDRQEVNAEDEFRRMGLAWKKTLDELKRKGMFTLKLTPSQEEEFNDFFDRLFRHSHQLSGDEMSSSVVRLAVNLCRMMSVTALLRSLEEPALAQPDPATAPDNLKDGIVTHHYLSITDADFRAVLELGHTLYLHATHVLSFLISKPIRHRGMADREMLFARMPAEFTRRDLLEEARERGIPDNTVLSWLQRLVNKNAVIKVDGRGTYRKA